MKEYTPKNLNKFLNPIIFQFLIFINYVINLMSLKGNTSMEID